MIKNQMFIAAALFVGVAIGYCVPKDSGAVAKQDAPEQVAKSVKGNPELEASNQALRARIAELEKALAEAKEKREEPGDKKDEVRSDERKGREFRRPGAEMREEMKRMEKENPEQFAKMTNMVAKWRQRRVERAHSKLDFLDGVDTSNMTAKQKLSHERYQELLVRREEIEAKMANPEMTDEDRDDIMRDMMETNHEMRRLASEERDTLVSQMVQSLGYSGDDAAEVSATINDIIMATENGHGGPGGGPGGPGGPGGGMPPPSPTAK